MIWLFIISGLIGLWLILAWRMNREVEPNPAPKQNVTHRPEKGFL